jgi:hypothetical protein
MRIASIAVLLALACANSQAQANGVHTKQVTEAAAVCESGRSSRFYSDPADSCWAAFEEAVDRLEFAEAARVARRGCEKFGRGDYCTFMAWFDAAKPRVIVVRRGSENERIGRALAYASEFLWPVDVEDAELGLRAQAHLERALQPVATPARRSQRR